MCQIDRFMACAYFLLAFTGVIIFWLQLTISLLTVLHLFSLQRSLIEGSKATCTVAKIAQMAYWLDSEKVDMEKFFNATAIEEKLNVYQKVSGTGPHGMVTRMDSLVMLLHWMGSNDQFDKEVVKSTMAKLKAIKITFKQDTSEQQSLAAEEDEEFDLLPTAIDDILCHQPTVQKMTVLQRKAQAGHVLTFTETLFFMRCLLVHLTLGNGQRVGAVTNMTLTEFKEGKARQRKKGGTLRVKVRRHKTKRQGRAKLFMEKRLQSWAETWAARIRPASSSDNFLVTTTGKEVKSKHHHMHSMRFGKDTGQRIPNATLSRMQNTTFTNVQTFSDVWSKPILFPQLKLIPSSISNIFPTRGQMKRTRTAWYNQTSTVGGRTFGELLP